MGGRGGVSGGFYRETRNRKTFLQNEISALDAQIAAIDAEADRVYQARYNEELAWLQENQRYSRYRYTGQGMTDQAADEALSAKAVFLEGTSRGELATKRKKRQMELKAIQKGQRTMF